MLERIVVPLDGSPLSERVLLYVARFAKAFQCQVTLLHIIDQSNLTEGVRSVPHSLIEKMREEASASAEAYLREKAEALSSQGLQVLTSVQHGEPDDVIAGLGDADTTLIAMSTHARSGLDRMMVGSVADRVLQSVRSPLLLIRPRDDAAESDEITRFIVPLDGSPLAESVLPLVTDIAKALRAAVTLVWVLPSTTGLHGSPDLPADVLLDAEGTANSYLVEVTGRLKQAGLEADHHVLRKDNAADAIVDYAHDVPNDIIAMSTHGRSGLGRWVLGSVTSQVVRSSGSPVLVVRSRDDAR